MTELSKELISSTRNASTSYNERKRVEEVLDKETFKELMQPSDQEEEQSIETADEQNLLSSFMPLPSTQLQERQFFASIAVSSINNVPALSPDAALLFEKMASSMLILYSSGDQETTLFVDNHDSIFCGTRITIKEFSTAPKIFNVHISSNPSSLHLINAHKAALLNSFEQSKFPFSVHRLETEQQSSDFGEQQQESDENHD
jgi:hypothetical protein